VFFLPELTESYLANNSFEDWKFFWNNELATRNTDDDVPAEKLRMFLLSKIRIEMSKRFWEATALGPVEGILDAVEERCKQFLIQLQPHELTKKQQSESFHQYLHRHNRLARQMGLTYSKAAQCALLHSVIPANARDCVIKEFYSLNPNDMALAADREMFRQLLEEEDSDDDEDGNSFFGTRDEDEDEDEDDGDDDVDDEDGSPVVILTATAEFKGPLDTVACKECAYCRRLGHTWKNCSDRLSGKPQFEAQKHLEGIPKSFMSNSLFQFPLLDVVVNGTPVRAVLYSSFPLTAITEDLYYALKKRVELRPTNALLKPVGSPMKALGEGVLSLKVSNTNIEEKCHCFVFNSMITHMIIGYSVLSRLGIELDFGSRTIHCRGYSFPFKSRR